MNLTVNQPITKENRYKICFVCLGNICRSPTAEGVFQHLINEQGLESYFEIDSAGTSAYHIGESAHNNSRRTANSHGIKLHSKARQFSQSDFDNFDLILAMDRENLQNIKEMAPNASISKIALLRDFDPQSQDGQVPDPYHGGPDGFEKVFQIVKRSCERLLDKLNTHIQNE